MFTRLPADEQHEVMNRIMKRIKARNASADMLEAYKMLQVAQQRDNPDAVEKFQNELYVAWREDIEDHRRGGVYGNAATGNRLEPSRQTLYNRKTGRAAGGEKLTELEEFKLRAWRYRRNRLVHGNPDNNAETMYVHFGILERVSPSKKTVRIYNHNGHYLSMRRSTLEGASEETELEINEKVELRWQQIIFKCKEMLGQRVAVSLDMTTLKNPAFFTDITKAEGIAAAVPQFDPFCGADIIYQEYEEKVEPERKTRSYAKQLDDKLKSDTEARKISRPSLMMRVPKLDNIPKSPLDGQAMSLEQMEKLKVDLSKQRQALEKEMKGIQEKLGIELDRIDESKVKIRDEWLDAQKTMNDLKHKLDGIQKISHDLMKEKTQAEEMVKTQTMQVDKRLRDLDLVIEQTKKLQIRRKREEAKGGTLGNIVPMSAKAEIQVQANSAATLLNMVEKDSEKTDLLAGLDENTLRALAGMIAQHMPQQPEPENNNAETEMWKARALAAEQAQRNESMARAQDRRLYETQQESDERAKAYNDLQAAVSDTEKESRKRAITILKAKGDSIYQGRHRILLNSKKVINSLARNAGCVLSGSFEVEIKEPYYSYEGQEETNSYICDIPDFGKECIVAIVYKQGNTNDMIAATIMNTSAGWEKMLDEVCTDEFGDQWKSRMDIKPELWADAHFTTVTRLQEQEMVGDN